MSELIRSNKVTAFWQGEGVARGVFYKTHNKIKEVLSDEVEGFAFPEGDEENPTTAQDKLAAFKNYLMINATQFGIEYDPVDRRADEFKFPNKYDEETFKEYSKTMAETAISAVLEKVQKNVIDGSLVKQDLLVEGTEVAFAVGDTPEISIGESYNNGNIKYAEATYPVAITVNGETANSAIVVQVVSGQLKKPRELSDGVVLTQTGIKNFLTEQGILPEIPKKEKASEEDGEDAGEDLPTADGADVE